MISVGNYSIVSITETHDTNLTLRVGKEKTWDTAYSTPTTGIHETATMTSGHVQLSLREKTSVTCTKPETGQRKMLLAHPKLHLTSRKQWTP